MTTLVAVLILGIPVAFVLAAVIRAIWEAIPRRAAPPAPEPPPLASALPTQDPAATTATATEPERGPHELTVGGPAARTVTVTVTASPPGEAGVDTAVRHVTDTILGANPVDVEYLGEVGGQPAYRVLYEHHAPPAAPAATAPPRPPAPEPPAEPPEYTHPRTPRVPQPATYTIYINTPHRPKADPPNATG